MGWKAIKEHYQIDHTVQVTEKGICIGSPYIHDLLVITPQGELEIGQVGIRGSQELIRIHEQMSDDSALLKRLAFSEDVFEKSVSVFTYDGATIVECQCEELGWPNVTHDGQMMYENTFSADREQVVKWAIRNAECGIECYTDSVARNEEALARSKASLEKHYADLEILRAFASLRETKGGAA